jgi:hypothetical protein
MHFNNGLVAAKNVQTGIIFAPFAVFGHYSKYLLPKFILSAAFPLSVFALHFRKARSDSRLNFAWLCFLIGSFSTVEVRT